MRQPRTASLLLPLAGLALLNAWSEAAAQAPARHVLRSRDPEVYQLVGQLRVVAATGSDVVVDVVRRGRDAADVVVEQGDVRGHEALRVHAREHHIVYPAMGARNSVRSRLREDGTFGGDAGHGFFSSHDVEIRGDGSGSQSWTEVTVAVPTGRRVALHLMAGDATVQNVDGDLSLDIAAASLTTDHTRGQLHVDAGSGAVRVTDAEGVVDLDLGSGGVQLSRVRSASLKIDAGSGSLRGSDIESPKLDLDLGSGSTTLDRVRTRNLRVDSGSGSVDVELLAGVDDARLEAGSGSVTLRVPTTFGATLDVDSGSGGIESELPIAVTHRERDHLTGRIGDGRGRVVIETGSGSVRLRKS